MSARRRAAPRAGSEVVVQRATVARPPTGRQPSDIDSHAAMAPRFRGVGNSPRCLKPHRSDRIICSPGDGVWAPASDGGPGWAPAWSPAAPDTSSHISNIVMASGGGMAASRGHATLDITSMFGGVWGKLRCWAGTSQERSFASVLLEARGSPGRRPKRLHGPKPGQGPFFTLRISDACALASIVATSGSRKQSTGF